MDKKLTVEGCNGCVKKDGNVCIVIKEPGYFLNKYGECFAKSEDIDELNRIEMEIERYRQVNVSNIERKVCE